MTCLILPFLPMSWSIPAGPVPASSPAGSDSRNSLKNDIASGGGGEGRLATGRHSAQSAIAQVAGAAAVHTRAWRHNLDDYRWQNIKV